MKVKCIRGLNSITENKTYEVLDSPAPTGTFTIINDDNIVMAYSKERFEIVKENKNMKELIQVKTNEQGQQLVSARELHKGLEIKSRFNDWINNRIAKYGFEKNSDYTKFLVECVRGQNVYDYALTLDMAKELSMVENNDLGRKFRKYFIECEKKLKEVATPKLPQTYKEALIELVKTIEEKEKIEEEKNRLIHQGKLYTATELAKELGFRSAKVLNDDLEEKKIQYRVNGTWVLAARYSECGYQSIKQIELNNGKVIYDRKWTGKGRDWLVNEIYA